MLTHRTEDQALAGLIDEQLGARGSTTVHHLSRRRSEYSTSAPIDELNVVLSDGSKLELMAKRLGRDALLGDANDAKPDFVYDPAREVAAYGLLADEPNLPRCWGALHEPGGALLVLERIPGLALRHTGEIDSWVAAARWLGAFHTRWADPHEQLLAAHPRLLRYDRSHHEHLLERALGYSAVAGTPLPPVVPAGHAIALDILSRVPASLLHGEFYASNVLVAPAGAGTRIVPLDWETVGVGCPLLDLAALTSGDWEPWERLAMEDAYRQTAPVELDDAGFERARCAAELVVSVQWMGWASGWQPPVDQITDWLGHATAVAEALVGSPPMHRGAAVAHQAARRTVIVNADDLGLSEGVNRGIFEAHDHGIVTSASLMVRGSPAVTAACGASTRPALALGLHLDLAEWEYCDGAWRAVYEVVDVDDQRAVQDEIERQLSRFVELTGRQPTHIDSHQHVHGRPLVGAVARAVADRLRVPLRSGGTIGYLGNFYGQHATGEPLPEAITTENMIRLVEGLPPGVTELACHPGYPEGLDNVYSSERLVELQVLCNVRVRDALVAGAVELASFRDVLTPAP